MQRGLCGSVASDRESKCGGRTAKTDHNGVADRTTCFAEEQVGMVGAKMAASIHSAQVLA
eukprot:895200-Pyramimonas_sp.AAC.1